MADIEGPVVETRTFRQRLHFRWPIQRDRCPDCGHTHTSLHWPVQLWSRQWRRIPPSLIETLWLDGLRRSHDEIVLTVMNHCSRVSEQNEASVYKIPTFTRPKRSATVPANFAADNPDPPYG